MPKNKDSKNNKQIRSLHFDLDINKLKEHYPNNNYTEAYNDIRKFLKNNGFEHIQGSGYISKNKLKPSGIEDIIKDLVKEYIWIQPSCKKIAAFIHRPEDELDLLDTMEQAHKTYNKSITLKEINKEINKEIKQTYKTSSYEPKSKNKNKSKDIER